MPNVFSHDEMIWSKDKIVVKRVLGPSGGNKGLARPQNPPCRDSAAATTAKTVLVVEDEPDILALIVKYLQAEGYRVLAASTGMAALQQVEKDSPNLIVLDWMLPEMNGIEVVKRLRAHPRLSAVPIIIITAKTDEADIVLGLESGADDYITKPFSPKVVVARVRAFLRRHETPLPASDLLKYGQLEMDLTRYEVKVGGREVFLTKREFRLLEHLLRNSGRLVTRESLLSEVWDSDTLVGTRTVDIHIHQLRQKIPLLEGAIISIRSIGYKLADGG